MQCVRNFLPQGPVILLQPGQDRWQSSDVRDQLSMRERWRNLIEKFGCIYDSKAWLGLAVQLVVRFTPHEAGFTLPILNLQVERTIYISSISAVALGIAAEH